MDDLDATLDGLERRLAALQAELGVPEPSPPTPPSAAAGDPLSAFGDELRATAARLISAYDDALAVARTGAQGDLFEEEVSVEARADLRGLCGLGRRLHEIPGVHSVVLRAYAGGHAALDVVLDRPVALVAELGRGTGPPIAVLEARPGRVAVEVGAPAGS